MRGPAMRRRRLGLRLSAVIVLVMVVNTILISRPDPGSASGQILLGAAPSQVDGSRVKGIEQVEAQIGRSLDLVRDFERWDSSFPSFFTSEMLDGDRTLFISVRAKRTNGSHIRWRDIADAPVGSDLHNKMIEWVEDIGALGAPVWFTFNHEPETSANTANGEAQDFVDAWRRFVDEFRNRGVTNVEFAWVMTHWAFEVDSADRRAAEKWYPGDEYVDYIGSDAYNWGDCRDSSTDSWRSLEDTLEPQRQFGLAHPDKGLVLGEVASTELLGDNGVEKASWLGDAKELFKKPGWEQFDAISFFNVVDESLPNCDWMIDSSPAALTAFVDLASDAFYGGNETTTPPPPDPDPNPTGDLTFVVGSPSALTSGETAVKNRFEGLGYSVGVADDDFIDTTTGSETRLIMVSSSVSDVTVGDTFRNTATPVWISKPWLFDDMGMTGPVGDLDYGSLKSSTVTIDDPTSPLAAGIEGAAIVTSSPTLISFGKPSGDSTVVSSVAGLATTFVYPAGATLADGSLAAGCRLASSTFQDGPDIFTGDGWALFDAAAEHAMAGCPTTTPGPDPDPEPDPDPDPGPNPLPSVEIVSPTEGTVVTGTVVITATASDDTRVTSVAFAVDGTAIATDTSGADGWSASWNTGSVAGSVTLTATATDTQGAASTTSAVVTVEQEPLPSGHSVVMVVGNTRLSGGDSAIKHRLESIGYSVEVVDDDGATAGDGEGSSFVLITSSVDGRKIGSKFAESSETILVAQPSLFDDMLLTGPVGNTDFGTTKTAIITVSNSSHSLAAGFAGDLVLTNRSHPVPWGLPGAAASLVAEADGKATIFTYAAGDSLVDGSAAAGCRLSAPMFKNAPNFFTSEGWTIFDAAAEWAAGGCR